MHAARIAACAAKNQKPPRQKSESAKRPPTSGPMKAETPQRAETAAMTRGIKEREKRRLTAMKDSAANPPPPRPCARRPTSMTHMCGASALIPQPTT